MFARRWRGVAALMCVVAVVGCDCDAAKLKHRTVVDDMSVQAHGGVSCGGEPIELRALVFGGQAPFSYKWSPAIGIDDPTSASPTAQADATREYTVTVWDAQGLEKTATATVGRGGPPLAKLEFKKGDALTCAGEEVELDASKSVDRTGLPIRYYSWQLGDAAPRVGSEATSGVFVPTDGQAVKLIVTDASGCSASLEQVLEVRARPAIEVAFDEGASFMCDGESVSLAATATDADGALPASVGWDLDGNPSTLEVAGLDTGAFRPSGLPAVFTAADALGCDASIATDIEVHPLPTPKIRFLQGAANVCDGARVTLDAATSTDGLGGEVAKYAWDLDGEPSTIEVSTATTAPLVITGDRQVRLTVTDKAGCSASVQQPLVARRLPVADIAFVKGREDPCAGEGVQLSGAGSLDANGQPVTSLRWDFDLDGVVDSKEATPPEWAPTASQLVSLTVVDGFGCEGGAAIAVTPRALPTPKVTFVSGQDDVCSGSEVTLDASASRDADGNAVALYAWDVDADATTTEFNSSSIGPFAPTDSVRLDVTDLRGCTASIVKPVTVRERPVARIAFAEGDAAVCEGTRIRLDASSSHSPESAPIIEYRWDLDGDGQFDTLGATPEGFAASGDRTVKLAVEAANGCTSETTTRVSARALPLANLSFVQGRSDVCEGDAVALSAAGSTDADGLPVAQFTWTGAQLEGMTTEATPAFVPAASELIGVRVTDAQGCSAEKQVPLSVRTPPRLHVTFAEGSASVCENETVRLSAATSTDHDGALPALSWDLDANGTSDATGATTPLFTPTDVGAVRVIGEDALGCRAETSLAFSVRPAPTPLMSLPVPFVCQGEPVHFIGSDSSDADGNMVAGWTWQLATTSGTASSSQPVTASFIPASSPSSLVVTDALGCSAGTSSVVPIGSPRHVLSTGSTTGGETLPLDIVFAIDNSGSMTEEIEAVQRSINEDFADIIAASGLDWRIILVSRHGSARYNQSICISSPLSGTDCDPIPGDPAVTSRFFQHDTEVGSHDTFDVLLNTYRTQWRRINGDWTQVPGWDQWLRSDAHLAFVAITDDESGDPWEDFVRDLVAEDSRFGSFEAPAFTWYSIVGLSANSPSTEPWAPTAPVQIGRCQGEMEASGREYQELSIKTGGLRFPLCELEQFGTLFQRLASSVVADAIPPCEVTLPADHGAHESTFVVEYEAGDGTRTHFDRVSGVEQCRAGAYWMDGLTMRLCDQACDLVTADPAAAMAVTGCSAP